MLRKYEPKPSHVVTHEEIPHEDNMTYVGDAVKILDQKEHVLRNKVILLVKILWRGLRGSTKTKFVKSTLTFLLCKVPIHLPSEIKIDNHLILILRNFTDQISKEAFLLSLPKHFLSIVSKRSHR